MRKLWRVNQGLGPALLALAVGMALFVPGASATNREGRSSAPVQLDNTWLAELGRAAARSAGNSHVSNLTSPTGSLASPTAGPTQSFTQIQWSGMKAAPLALGEAQGLAMNGKLYVFGGYPPPCCTPTVKSNVYDPATNTWSPLRDLPIGLTHAGNATDGQYIYFVGGFEALPGGGRTIGTVKGYKYNLATNTYTPLPDLPSPRAAGGLVVVGRSLHYFSGLTKDGLADVGDHYVLSLDGGTSWVSKAPLPNPRNHLGSVELGGKLYAVGGQHGEHSTLVTQSDVHRYDPTTNVWTRVASLPFARGHIAASTFVMGGRIIVVGGETAHTKGIADVVAYDPATNAWTKLTSLPSSKISGVADDIGGSIYFATGSYTNTTYKGVPVQPAPGAWTSRQPVPAAVLDAGGAVLGGKLYMVGGKMSSGYQRIMRVYNPATNSWTTGPSLPAAYPAVENPAVAAYNGKLYVFGGSTGPFSGAVTSSAVFDPATSRWTMLAPMALGRGGATAQAVGTKLYVVGGMDSSGASLSGVAVYDPATNRWGSAAAMATRRDNPGAASLGGKLYVFGGRTRNTDGSTINDTLATAEMYDPATNRWSARASMPTGRRTMAVTTLGGRIQLMGGERTSTGGTFAQNEEYNPATNSWRALAPMVTPRHGMVAGTVNGIAYIAGGGTTGGSSYTGVNEAFTLPGTDTVRPAVSSTTPASSATGVTPTTGVDALFSEPMNAATINTSTFSLLRQGTTLPVSASVTYNATSGRATLRPATGLAAGVTYTATIKGGSAGVKDLSGNPMTASKVWSFTTAPVSTPQGVKGEYYDNADLTALKLTRTDPTVNFNWGSGSPHTAIEPDGFSVRWSGRVKVDYSESYTFYTTSNDGVRLWVNGQGLIDNWTQHATTENRGAITLQPGVWYPITLEYFEGSGSSVISLSYSSARTPKQVIPANHLTPGAS